MTTYRFKRQNVESHEQNDKYEEETPFYQEISEDAHYNHNSYNSYDNHNYYEEFYDENYGQYDEEYIQNHIAKEGNFIKRTQRLYHEKIEETKKMLDDSIQEHKEYYSSDSHWRAHQQSVRSREFIRKMGTFMIVFFIILGILWLISL